MLIYSTALAAARGQVFGKKGEKTTPRAANLYLLLVWEAPKRRELSRRSPKHCLALGTTSLFTVVTLVSCEYRLKLVSPPCRTARTLQLIPCFTLGPCFQALIISALFYLAREPRQVLSDDLLLKSSAESFTLGIYFN